MKILKYLKPPSWRVHFRLNHYEDVTAWTKFGAKIKAAQQASNVEWCVETIFKLIYAIEGPFWEE